MHGSRWLLGFAWMALSACAGDAALPPPDMGDDGARDPGPSQTPRVGGSTGDFGGDCACDLMRRELALDEPDEVLGFAAEDLLSRIEGEYALPMVWGDNCEGESPGLERCAGAPPAFTGTTTEVRIAVDATTATSARVDECNRGGPLPQCHTTTMWLPVSGSLRTADGLLDEEFQVELSTSTLDEFGIGAQVGTDELTGALESQVATLNGIEWRFELTSTRARFEVFVVTGPHRNSRVVSPPAEGGENPSGHSWGIEADLDEVRR